MNLFCQKLFLTDALWVCPPVNLILPVVKHLANYSKLMGILLVPFWRASSFYTHLFHNSYLNQIFVDLFIIKARFNCSNAATASVFSANRKFSVVALHFDTSNKETVPIRHSQLLQLTRE